MFLKLFCAFKEIARYLNYENSHIGKYLANAVEITFYVFPFIFLFFQFYLKVEIYLGFSLRGH